MFWASWCGPCRRELPMLGNVQKLVGREHLEVIAINSKKPRSDYQAILRANRDVDLRFANDAKGKVSDLYGVTALPNMFIIERDGTLFRTHRGYSEAVLESFAEELLSLLPQEVLQRRADGWRTSTGQRGLDFANEAGGLAHRRMAGDDLAVAADQELGEVPADRAGSQ